MKKRKKHNFINRADGPVKVAGNSLGAVFPSTCTSVAIEKHLRSWRLQIMMQTLVFSRTFVFVLAVLLRSISENAAENYSAVFLIPHATVQLSDVCERQKNLRI